MSNQVNHGNFYRQDVVNDSLTETFGMDPMNNNQNKSKGQDVVEKEQEQADAKAQQTKSLPKSFSRLIKKLRKVNTLKTSSNVSTKPTSK